MLFNFLKNELMYRYIIILSISFSLLTANAQTRKDVISQKDTLRSMSVQKEKAEMKDTFPRPIPFMLSEDLFVPKKYLFSYVPWTYAPYIRPTVFILPTYGFNGSVGFGLYSTS